MYFYQNSLVKDCHVYIFFANKSRCTCLFLICIKQLDRLDIKSISLSECISVLKALKSKPDVQACISIFYFSVRYCPEQMVHVVYCIMFEFFCFRWHDNCEFSRGADLLFSAFPESKISLVCFIGKSFLCQTLRK